MPEPEQRLLKANPFNVVNNRARGLLEVKQDYCAADFGSITVVGDGVFLSMDGEDIIGFHMGNKNLEVSLQLFSESDDLLLKIERNVWVSGDPLPWDIEARWQTLTLREKARKINLKIDAKTIPMSVQGELWKSGKRFVIDNKGITFEGRNIDYFHDKALVGMRLDFKKSTYAFTLSPQQNDLRGICTVDWPNKRERLWRARDAWRRIKPSKPT